MKQRKSANREEISQAFNINGMFIGNFLQALADMGMLEQNGGNYKNTQISQTLFIDDSPNYQGDWFKIPSTQDSSWNNLAELLTRKVPKPDNFNAGPSRDFINFLAQRSMRGELQKVVKVVSEWEGFKNAKTLIDIGGGHGLYAIALCQENENIMATVFDKPFVTKYTKDFIEKYDMESRIKIQSGDITCDDLNGEYSSCCY